MLSRIRPPCQLVAKGLGRIGADPIVRRSAFTPATPYDTRSSKKMQISYVLREYWETIPLFLVTCFSIGLGVAATVWAINNKVDVIWRPNSRNNISRTMDLRNPTVHKLITINERYLPWPEMQDVLDKMKYEENRHVLKHAERCSYARAAVARS